MGRGLTIADPRRTGGLSSRSVAFAIFMALTPASLVGTARAQTLQGVAQARHEQGLRLYDAGSYEAALEEFRAAVAARSSPVPRIYIARSLRRLGRFAEAIEEFHLTWREASDLCRVDPYYEQIRDAAEGERESILARVGWITVHVDAPPPGLVLRLNARQLPVQALDLPLPVDPGPITVRAEAPGTASVSRTLEIAAEQRETVRLAMAPEPLAEEAEAAEPEGVVRLATDHRSAMMAGTFVALGVAAASAIAAGVLFGVADGIHAELLDQCPDFECPESEWSGSLERDRDLGEAVGVGMYATLGVASFSAVAMVVLAALTPWGGAEPAASLSAGGAVPRLTVRW